MNQFFIHQIWLIDKGLNNRELNFVFCVIMCFLCSRVTGPQDSQNFDRCLRLCCCNQHHLCNVCYSPLLWNDVCSTISLLWNGPQGSFSKLQAISYSGRQPPASRIHSPKKIWIHLNKAIGFPFSAKPTQYIKAVNLYWSAQQWPITPPPIQAPQESSFLAGSDMMVHTLYSLEYLPCSAAGAKWTMSWTKFCSQGKLVKSKRCQKYSNSQELVNAVPETLPHSLPHTVDRERMLPWLRSAVLMHYHTSLEGSVNNNLLG